MDGCPDPPVASRSRCSAVSTCATSGGWPLSSGVIGFRPAQPFDRLRVFVVQRTFWHAWNLEIGSPSGSLVVGRITSR